MLDQRHKQIIKEYKKGLSTHKVAIIFNTSSSYVYWVLKKYDIKLRGKYDYDYGKYKIDKRFFNKINSPVKAYWLGVLMADGYIDGKYKVRLAVSQRDEKWLKSFIEDLSSNINLRYLSCHKKDDIVYIQINSKKMVEDLSKYRIIPRKSGKEIFPDIKESFYPDFIRGDFDGDGCARVAKDMRGCIQPHFLLCGSKSLMQKIKIILIKNCKVNNNKIIKTGKICQLRFVGTNQVKRIYDYIYYVPNVQCLRRKRKLYDDFYGHLRRENG